MEKKEALRRWQNLEPDQPILPHFTPLAADARGSTFGACGIRISGNPEFIDAVPNTVIENASSFTKELAGSYKVLASALNVRAGAGTQKNIIVTVPKGTLVKCYGYYTKILDTKWLYVQFTYKSTKYTGFVSAKYVAK